MLMIRMSRVGKKKYPLYRIVIQEKSKDPWGKALEILGNYNPHSKELNVKKERIEHWMSVGAKLSATVNNLLITKEVIKGEKMKAAKLSKKKKKGEAEKKEGGEKKEEAKAEEKPAESKDEAKEEKPAEEKKEEKKEGAKEEKKDDKKDGKVDNKKEEENKKE